MRYSGGKFRMASHLAQAILPYRAGCQRFVEPFCGGLSATAALQPDVASDASLPLISLFQDAQDGWTPPDVVTEEDYRAAKSLPPEDTLHGFIAFGCSFGGKYWGGYAREGKRGTRNFARDSWNSLRRKLDKLGNTKFLCCNYLDWDFGEGDLVYCDPPYAGTTNGYSVKGWDAPAFFLWAKEQANRGATVFISEYALPESLTADDIHLTVNARTDFHTSRRPQEVTEHLFLLRREPSHVK